MNSHFTLQFRS